MKTWTLVIEMSVPDNFTKEDVEASVEDAIVLSDMVGKTFRVMETIEAPYGPGGVVIKEVKP